MIGTGYGPSGDFDSEPGYEAPAIYLKAYNIHNGAFTAFDRPIAPPLPQSPDGFTSPQILTTNSLSPGGSHATFFDVLQANGYLVDLTNGETLLSRDCSFKALIWKPEPVLVGTYGVANEDCTPFLAWINLNTGEVIADFSKSIAGELLYRFYRIFIPGNGQLLLYVVNSDGSHLLSMIEGDTYRILAQSDESMWISPDDSGVVFYNDASLVYMPLQAPFEQGIITDLPANHIPRVVFHESGHIAWSNEYRVDGAIEISRSTYESGLGTSVPDVFYAYDLPHWWAFAPDLVYLATLYDERLVVYAPIFQQVWSSTASSLTPNIPNNATLYWADDRRVVTELADYEGSLVGDLETGMTIPPPETGARLINISPDGRWWLYLVPETVDHQFEFRGYRLIAYDSTTGEIHVIKDAIADGDDARFLLVEGREFIWWTPR